MQFTTEKVVRFLGYAQGYINKYPAERSKLTFALQEKMLKKYKGIREEKEKSMREKLDELQAEFCSKDKDGNFLEAQIEVKDQIVFRKKFKKDEERKVKDGIDAFEKELDSKLVDIQPHVVAVPKDIDITWYNEFVGFVFEPMKDEDLESWYLEQTPPPKEEKNKK